MLENYPFIVKNMTVNKFFDASTHNMKYVKTSVDLLFFSRVYSVVKTNGVLKMTVHLYANTKLY